MRQFPAAALPLGPKPKMPAEEIDSPLRELTLPSVGTGWCGRPDFECDRKRKPCIAFRELDHSLVYSLPIAPA
jgi:hypothetical protein